MPRYSFNPETYGEKEEDTVWWDYSFEWDDKRFLKSWANEVTGYLWLEISLLIILLYNSILK